MTLEEIAKDLATKAHADQNRWDGSPYITHPAAVVAILKEDFPDSSEELIAAAWLHDVVEDCEDYDLITIYNELYDNGISDEAAVKVCYYVRTLTNTKTKTYTKYIKRIGECRDSLRVKICDLKHNLSDLEPGQRRDKYELAKMYLEEKLEQYETNSSC